MIGILLLIVALFYYFKPQKRWISYFLYASFMLNGFCLLTDSVIGFKNADMAVIYTFIISINLILKGKYKRSSMSFIKQYKWLIIFFFCSFLFSVVYYKFTLFDVLQGSRAYLLLFSLPIVCNMSEYNFKKLMKAVFIITSITCFLYIMQTAVGRPLMPYGDGTADSYTIDFTTGLARFYNMPPFTTFFLALSFVNPQIFGKRVIIFRILFFLALVCSLGRTAIAAGILVTFLAVFFSGKASRLIKVGLAMSILFIPLADVIQDRFRKGETDKDLSILLKGGAIDYENTNDGGTMTYRIAWVLERYNYIIERPIVEQIFGLGFISDANPKTVKKYNFRLGLYNPYTKTATQLTTPDIAYGNLLTQWGFVGGSLYLIFVISMIYFFYKRRKFNAYTAVVAAYLIALLLLSFSGNEMSQPKNFILYFIVLSTFINKQKQDEINSHRVRIG